MAKLIGTLALFIAFASMAEARVHSITPTQYLSPPYAYSFEEYPALAVAINGDSLIIIADWVCSFLCLVRSTNEAKCCTISPPSSRTGVM